MVMPDCMRPRILLIGIEGVYNYGCEAIVRGTESIIRSEYPSAEITYASCRPHDDKMRLAGCEVKIVRRKMPGRYSLRNIMRKTLSLGGIKWSPIMDSRSLLRNCDAVFSIGGDIYTLNSIGGYSMSFPKFGETSLLNGIPYVLWGASVGPFSTNPAAEKAYARHLKRVSIITAREPETIKYLKTLGVHENVLPCADPAFVVAPEIGVSNGPNAGVGTIGINLSPLSALYGRHSQQESIDMQAGAIERIIKTLGVRIVLIPHVVCGFNEVDDDFEYLRRLRQSISPEYRGNVGQLEKDLGFIGTKREIIKCNIIVAARMHCAINALAACVPTIFVSYSRKAAGMCRYVYGNGEWLVPIDRIASCGGKIETMLGKEREIRDYLSQRIPDIRRDAYQQIRALQGLIGK